MREVLSLDKLTEHQIAKLEECLAAELKFIHLKALAGAGKTFVDAPTTEADAG